MMTKLWKSYGMGQAPVLRYRTIAWHVNEALNYSGDVSKEEHLLLTLMSNNVLKYRQGVITLARKTPARVRDCKRFPAFIEACIRDAVMSEEGFRKTSLPKNWQDADALREVLHTLNRIKVM
tara:strand:- start:111 stop:476 length:366 start_codon:yes stop_codon:yes gene_type:complete